MSNLDKVKLTMPDGSTVFEANENVRVIEAQEPFWLFNGAETARTLAEAIDVIDNDTAQVYVGTGSRVRHWTIEFVQTEGSSDTWGSTSSSDDVVVKANELGQELATAQVDSTNPMTFEYGEYSSGGTHGPQTVVPGEVNIPTEFGPGESATSFVPSLQLLDAADLSNVIHSAP